MQLKEVAKKRTFGQKLRHFSESQTTVGYIFVLPNILVFVVFTIIPMFCAIAFSMMDFTITWSRVEWVWFEQFQKVFADPRWWNCLKNTAIYTVGLVIGQFCMSLLMASLIKEQKAINVVFRSAYFLPVLSSMTIVSIVWKFLLNSEVGAVTYYLRQMGIHWGLLSDPNQALTIVTIVAIWKGFGYQMVIFLAALQGVPEVYYEAASIDGVGRFRKFFNITIPQIMPTISFCLVTSIIGSFQVFDSVYAMTSGGPLRSTETVVYYIYQKAFVEYKMGYASALAMCLFVIIVVLSLFTLKKTDKPTDE